MLKPLTEALYSGELKPYHGKNNPMRAINAVTEITLSVVVNLFHSNAAMDPSVPRRLRDAHYRTGMRPRRIALAIDPQYDDLF